MADRREFLQLAAALVAAPGVAAGAGRAMHKRPIPGTGETLAVVGLGNATPFAEGDLQRTGELVDTLLAHGGGYIDTSFRGRFTVGEVMRRRRAHDELFLGTYLESGDPAGLADEIRAVQDAQGGGVLDLVLSREPADYLRRAAEFQQLKESGLTRYLGVARHRAEYYPPIMEAIREGVVDFIQVNYSLLEPEAANEVLPLAMEHGVAVITNRPFVNGEYFPRVAGRALPDWAADFDCASWAQFSLKYILAHPAVTCAITETSNPRHAADNLAAGSGRLPDDATRARMRELVLEPE
ncbi:MAG: aldo/keto reductase [Woeseiaceae bacterium]|nr:aldo/keto reductase [Woeseiaceae bacterium]